MELKDIITIAHELDIDYKHENTGVVKPLNEWIWDYEEIHGRINSTYNTKDFETWVKDNLVETDENNE